MGLEESFAAMRAAGAEGIEILVTQDPETQNPNKIEELANRYDMPVVAIHAPLLLLTRRVFTSDPLVKIRRTLEMAKALDVGAIVLHPPLLWQVRYALWTIHEMQDLTAGTSTLITMENMYPTHVAGRKLTFHQFGSVSDLDRFEHVTLDTSHCAVAQQDICESYEMLKEKIVHIHLSDNRGKGRDSHAPIGEGILPIDDFVAGLDGEALRTIALEINPGPGRDGRENVEQLFADAFERVRDKLPRGKDSETTVSD